MDFPTFDQLLNPTLSALHTLGGSGSINEIVEQVIAEQQLPEAVVQQPHVRGNLTKLEYRLAWARTYLKKYGLINNSERGIWSLTSEGMKQTEVDTQELVAYVRQLDSKTSLIKQRPFKEDATPLEDIADPEDESALWKDVLLDKLSGIPSNAFERLCQRLLRESGFTNVEVTGRSGDGGIDGHGIVRIAGLISFNVLFQSKRYQGSISPSIVRDFRGAMSGRADKGLLITTGSFTREARKEATRDGAQPIDLIDGDLLTEKLKELKLGVNTNQVEVVEIDQDWFDSI